MKKYLVLVLLIFLGSGLGFSFFIFKSKKGKTITTAVELSTISSTEPQKISPTKLRRTALAGGRLSVPFAPQAPFAHWDELHEEACEEAAAIMIAYAFAGKKLTSQIMENEIQKLVVWEKEKFGFYEDTNAEQTAQILKDYFHLKTEVEYTFEFEKIKKALDDDELIITLAAGRELHNPFYKQPGPVYHALVIKGYRGNKLITNDPGTKRGENYTYDFETVHNASHEWAGEKEKILTGRPNMITVWK